MLLTQYALANAHTVVCSVCLYERCLQQPGVVSVKLMLCRWKFYVHSLGRGHIVSVALGPPEDVVDAWGVRSLYSVHVASQMPRDLAGARMLFVTASCPPVATARSLPLTFKQVSNQLKLYICICNAAIRLYAGVQEHILQAAYDNNRYTGAHDPVTVYNASCSSA